MSRNLASKYQEKSEDRISSFLDSFELVILEASRWKWSAFTYLKDFTLSNYQLIWIKEGVIRIHSQKGIEVGYEGDIFLFEPFVRYSIEVAGDEALLFYYVTFDVSPHIRQSEFYEEICFEKEKVQSSPAYELICQLLVNEIDNFDNQSGFEKAIEIHLIELFLMIIRSKDTGKSNEISMKSSRAEELVSKSIYYVETHLREPISIETIARENFIGTNTLYKAFKEVTDLGPSQFLSQYKLRLVAQCLNETNLSLEEIANRFGYSSASHLSKNYKKFYGISPRKW